MSLLRYSVTVQFNVEAGDPNTVEEKLVALGSIADVVEIKAKSVGKGKKETEVDK